MSQREHLIPTPTVDRNGKATTVYRKSVSSTPAKLLPAPVVTNYDQAKSGLVMDTVVELFRGTVIGIDQREIANAALRSCSSEVVERVHSSLTGLGFDSGRSELSQLLRVKLSYFPERRSELEGELDDALCFYPLVRKRSYNVAERIIASLRKYPQVPATTERFSGESDEVMAKYVALVRVIDSSIGYPNDRSIFKDDSLGLYVFEDDKFTELVLEYPEQTEQIISVIRERGTRDPEAIRMVIEGSTTALSSGAL